MALLNELPNTVANDYNLYTGLIAIGIGLAACLAARFTNGGTGTRPVGDALSWFVHTRLGSGPRSWLGKKLDLGVLATATVGELIIVALYWVRAGRKASAHRSEATCCATRPACTSFDATSPPLPHFPAPFARPPSF